jgi:hypothetical protein
MRTTGDRMKKNSLLRVQEKRTLSTISVSERIDEVSPRTKARMAGDFYLATILTGVFTQQFISHLVYPGLARPPGREGLALFRGARGSRFSREPLSVLKMLRNVYICSHRTLPTCI